MERHAHHGNRSYCKSLVGTARCRRARQGFDVKTAPLPTLRSRVARLAAYETAVITATALAAIAPIQIRMANQYCGRGGVVATSAAFVVMTDMEILANVRGDNSRQRFRGA
jgi:hypothetical protein